MIIPLVNRSVDEDTQFSDKFSNTKACVGAIQRIHDLVDFFDGNVWIVSKAGPRMESLTRKWLDSQDFFNKTKIPEEHLVFCRERPEKEPICRDLNITHFVDDRVHIMHVIKDTVQHLYLFGDKIKNKNAPKWVELVDSWEEVYVSITENKPCH